MPTIAPTLPTQTVRVIPPAPGRREPYHKRIEYRAGNTAKKAAIVRACLKIGHEVLTLSHQPVLDAYSHKGELIVKTPNYWIQVEGLLFFSPK